MKRSKPTSVRFSEPEEALMNEARQLLGQTRAAAIREGALRYFRCVIDEARQATAGATGS